MAQISSLNSREFCAMGVFDKSNGGNVDWVGQNDDRVA